MDTINSYRQIIEKVLSEYSQLRPAHGDIQRQTVFDRDKDHYLLLSIGWDKRRIHGCIIHLDIIDGKIWIQRDGTEHGIAMDLEEAGIAKEHIVLGFRSPEFRKHSGYAVA